MTAERSNICKRVRACHFRAVIMFSTDFFKCRLTDRSCFPALPASYSERKSHRGFHIPCSLRRARSIVIEALCKSVLNGFQEGGANSTECDRGSQGKEILPSSELELKRKLIYSTMSERERVRCSAVRDPNPSPRAPRKDRTQKIRAK